MDAPDFRDLALQEQAEQESREDCLVMAFVLAAWMFVGALLLIESLA
jgi:hypothetical protein